MPNQPLKPTASLDSAKVEKFKFCVLCKIEFESVQ